MNKTRLFAIVSLLAVASLACAITDMVGGTVSNSVSNAIGGDINLTSQTSLWADVPRMDGLESSDLDMPLVGKILMQTMMSQYLAEGKGSADWIVFSTGNDIASIQAFYEAQLLGANGWESNDESTCFSGNEQGIDQVGLFCVFLKQEAGADVGLLLFASPNDDQAGQNNLFFIRVENNDVTPSP